MKKILFFCAYLIPFILQAQTPVTNKIYLHNGNNGYTYDITSLNGSLPGSAFSPSNNGWGNLAVARTSTLNSTLIYTHSQTANNATLYRNNASTGSTISAVGGLSANPSNGNVYGVTSAKRLQRVYPSVNLSPVISGDSFFNNNNTNISGDSFFDNSGNIYVVAINGTTKRLYRINVPLIDGTTPSATFVIQLSGTLPDNFQGMAIYNNKLYVAEGRIASNISGTRFYYADIFEINIVTGGGTKISQYTLQTAGFFDAIFNGLTAGNIDMASDQVYTPPSASLPDCSKLYGSYYFPGVAGLGAASIIQSIDPDNLSVGLSLPDAAQLPGLNLINLAIGSTPTTSNTRYVLTQQTNNSPVYVSNDLGTFATVPPNWSNSGQGLGTTIDPSTGRVYGINGKIVSYWIAGTASTPRTITAATGETNWGGATISDDIVADNAGNLYVIGSNNTNSWLFRISNPGTTTPTAKTVLQLSGSVPANLASNKAQGLAYLGDYFYISRINGSNTDVWRLDGITGVVASVGSITGRAYNDLASCGAVSRVAGSFDFNCGGAEAGVQGTVLVANGTAQQTLLRIPVQNAVTGFVQINVDNSQGFSTSPSPYQIFINQGVSYIDIPITYTSASNDQGGNKAIAVTSSQGNGSCIINAYVEKDSDGDGVIDAIDLDDDNDGILDCDEKRLTGVALSDIFSLKSNATSLSANEVQLTAESQNQQGQMWSVNKINFAESFVLKFQAYLGNDDGADGIAAVFHNDPAGQNATGVNGIGLGAATIKNGIVLELDTFNNNPDGSNPGARSKDITNNHGMIWDSDWNFSGAVPSVAVTNLSDPVDLGNLEDDQYHDVVIYWNPFSRTLAYYVDEKLAGSYTHSGSLNDFCQTYFAIPASQANKLVTYGYTASTGLYTNSQRIRFNDLCNDFPQFIDTDGDGVADQYDLDSDADGCPDALEGTDRVYQYQNNSSFYSNGVILGGVNANGVPLLVNPGSTPTVDVNGIDGQGPGTAYNAQIQGCIDTDGDGYPNNFDLDDDNDGILDTDEVCYTRELLSRNVFPQSDTAASFLTGWATSATNGGDLYFRSGYGLEFRKDGSSTATISQNISGVQSGNKINLNDVYWVRGTNSSSNNWVRMSVLYNGTEYLRIQTSGGNNNNVIITSPGGATWTVNGASSGTLPTTGSNTTSGKSNVVITLPAGVPANGAFSISFSTGGNASSRDIGLASVNIPNICNFTWSNDVDNDNIPNDLDNDSDGDGCPDSVEGTDNVTPSIINGIGQIVPATDVDANGIPKAVQNGGSANVDGNNVSQNPGSSYDSATYLCYVYAANDIHQIPAGVTATGNLITNDTSADGTVIHVKSATYTNASGASTNLSLGTPTAIYSNGVLAGNITLNANGTYTFVPSSGYSGTVPVNYIAENANGRTDPANLSIKVLPKTTVLNDKPVAQNDTAVTEIGTTVTSNALVNDSYIDGTGLTITAASQGATPIVLASAVQVAGIDVNGNAVSNAGSITINPTTGQYTYIPAAGFVETVNPISYTISDSNGLTDTANIAITVITNIGNSTFANDDAKAAPKGTAQLSGNVKTNDTDPEANTTTVTSATVNGSTLSIGTQTNLAGIGSLTLNADGTYIFIPDASYVGTTTVVYTICDNGSPVACSKATLYLTLLEKDDVCYNSANTATAGVNTLNGITLLQRAASGSGEWPGIRKSAHTVLESNTKGFVITRMTSDPAQTSAANYLSNDAQSKITNPQEGMIVFDEYSKCLKIYSDNSWKCFSTASCP